MWLVGVYAKASSRRTLLMSITTACYVHGSNCLQRLWELFCDSEI